MCSWNLLGIRPEPDELEACTKDSWPLGLLSSFSDFCCTRGMVGASATIRCMLMLIETNMKCKNAYEGGLTNSNALYKIVHVVSAGNFISIN
ncbi:hypothetical protein COLO4_28823 [Corchorus olitorius]|uniref:Uncharacterized protein n=1 Tax=Corchorus olitorius TaxID=93759 RepID=A0A1R3HI31_9ROSI|nr:hypothetical protein COLO4_28823 [Corchorus olitorius]